MLRFFIVMIVLVVAYVAWDQGAFGNARRDSGRDIRIAGEGPVERVGAAVDKGLAEAGKAVQVAGKKLERAAEGHNAPAVQPTP